jgi:hypothetical protein
MLLPALEAELVLDGCGRHWSGGITIPPTLLARRMSPVVARSGPTELLSRCPLVGDEQTSCGRDLRSEFDPIQICTVRNLRSSNGRSDHFASRDLLL